MLQPVYIIHETNEYDKFNLDPANRPVDINHLEKLILKIQRKNLLAEFPIVVDANMNVLDGQHRLLAAKALGVNVFYEVSANMTLEDVAPANDTQKIWGLPDYLHSYVRQGKPDYIMLKSFVTEFPDLHLSDAVWLCHSANGTGRSALQKEFTGGAYVCNNLESARRVASALLDFKPRLPTHFRQRQFVYAVQHLFSDPRYDHARMVKKLNGANGYTLQPRVSATDYFPLLNAIYNYRVTREDQIVEFSFRTSKSKPKKQAA